MTLAAANSRLSQLWQFPLLIVSAALLLYAGWLLVRPGPGPSPGQMLEVARAYLEKQRPEAAIAQLNAVLNLKKITQHQQGAAHMLMAEAIDMAQRQRRLSIAENYRTIIRQTRLAMAAGIEADAAAHRRLAQAYEALGQITDALAHYGKVVEMDRAARLPVLRRIIELHLERSDLDKAWESIAEYLESRELAESERAWAIGEKARILIERGQYEPARQAIAEAMKLDAGLAANQGVFNYWLGFCAWKTGDLAAAERHLRLARDQLTVQHPLDADAAWALGCIRQQQDDWPGAASFYAAVLQSHLDSRVAQSARLGRGLCRIALRETEAGMGDLQAVVRYLRDRDSPPARLKEETIRALQKAQEMLSAAGDYERAMELMADEQQLLPQPPPEFFARMASLYERRAIQMENVADGRLSDAARQEKARQLRCRAGDACIALSRALVLKDDKAYGQALWKGVELYESAGDLPQIISALSTFVSERPEDPHAPEAMLRLGHSYHAAGLFDKAIWAYRQCQMRYSRSLASSKTGVPLARAYIARGAEYYDRAEQTLRSVIENNPQITPEAQDFREALLELALLYYRTGRYEMSIARLEEICQRYPDDDRTGQLLFLMADAYRKSAMILEQRLREAMSSSTTRPALDIAEAESARNERLTRAKALFDRVVEYYRNTRPARDLDRLYLKLAHFYRADCVYDLGGYLEAIRLYDDAAFRYQEDPSALAAYVQIVNANVALGRIEEAKAANERAKWLLRHMPGGVFDTGTLTMPRQSWEQWLKWSGESGVWK